MSVLTIMGVQQLSAQVTINETNFPDEAFRDFVSRKFDTDTDDELSSSEIANAKVMDLSWIYVSDLKGIEYFTALTELDCSYSYLITLDVSKNVALEKLDCRGNDLTSLDLSSNTALTELYCSSNYLTSLDLSSNTALTELYCYSNDLTSLDLSSNTALTNLSCSSNDLTSLDLSSNTALT
ncbi:MAG: leucine-rich repeat domain-containing protein, partial [Paludibacteraceae bacterium]|nr:leucine-rich repeat domain-containing protein [Paludibacteraceae bacterium]